MAVIEVEGLTRRYRSRTGTFRRRTAVVEALRGVSFEVERGELFGLLGPNGAGKTTMIKVLTTLLLPTSGTARVLGFDVRRQARQIPCTALGLCLGALGLRGRNVSVFADVITACMLVVAGANVPLHLLPGWLQQISACIPLTHGIEAARAIANGASIGGASDLLLKELLIGGIYLVIGLAMLRFFEYEGRRSSSLETF